MTFISGCCSRFFSVKLLRVFLLFFPPAFSSSSYPRVTLRAKDKLPGIREFTKEKLNRTGFEPLRSRLFLSCSYPKATTERIIIEQAFTSQREFPEIFTVFPHNPALSLLQLFSPVLTLPGGSGIHLEGICSLGYTCFKRGDLWN